MGWTRLLCDGERRGKEDMMEKEGMGGDGGGDAGEMTEAVGGEGTGKRRWAGDGRGLCGGDGAAMSKTG